MSTFGAAEPFAGCVISKERTSPSASVAAKMPSQIVVPVVSHVVGRRTGAQLDIDLDYVMSAYRDSRLGNWIYGPGSKVFRSAGIDRLVSKPGNEAHRTYLERVGFVREGDQYVRDLTAA